MVFKPLLALRYLDIYPLLPTVLYFHHAWPHLSCSFISGDDLSITSLAMALEEQEHGNVDVHCMDCESHAHYIDVRCSKFAPPACWKCDIFRQFHRLVRKLEKWCSFLVRSVYKIDDWLEVCLWLCGSVRTQRSSALSSVGLPGASLVINRRLYCIATIKQVRASSGDVQAFFKLSFSYPYTNLKVRKNLIVDLSLGVITPLIVMALRGLVPAACVLL